MTADSAPAPTGPWNQTKTTKLKVGPIEVDITTRTEGSHVPPCVQHDEKEDDSGGGSSQLMAFFQQAASMIMQKLDEIRTAQTRG